VLNQRQTVFVFEFLKSGNATAAYVIAYGVENNQAARANTARLITNDNIQAEILRFKQVIEMKTGITIEAVVNRIAKLADKADKDSDKLKALDMLMKHLDGYVTMQDVLDKLTAEQAAEMIEKIKSYVQIKPDSNEIDRQAS
jgi:phage terminase small subunit